MKVRMKTLAERRKDEDGKSEEYVDGKRAQQQSRQRLSAGVDART